ncbi:hypothetical protein BSQ44_07645 [Aquibium oceanicum]|uniref:DUF1499 domain-containing protein n=1 Tax=Aquibium oceanicum TaxID=1670800 RepID=A0A1L3SPC8_9HYPH|nr:hypothetical protein BSQ44_07645 [Aquibium oceanicum]
MATRVTIERRPSRACEWASRLARFAAVLAIVGGLSHRYGLLETVPFFWVLGIIGVLAVVAVGLAIAGFIDVWEHGDKGGRKALAAGLLACAILVPFGLGGWRVFEYPRLVDVTTDTEDPPSFRSLALLRPPSANTIGAIDANTANLIETSYPDISGRRYAVSPDRVMQAVLAIMAERGWQVVATRGIPQQDSEMTMEARAFSRFMRFPADVAVRLTDEGASTFVDMRSASHYAQHDLGDNADRISRFLTELDAAMEAGTQ